jgi:hypothetical protein
MRAADLTALGVVLVIAIGGVYDMWAAVRWGTDATITGVVRAWARDHPEVPFAAGWAMCHLFRG